MVSKEIGLALAGPFFFFAIISSPKIEEVCYGEFYKRHVAHPSDMVVLDSQDKCLNLKGEDYETKSCYIGKIGCYWGCGAWLLDK